MKVKNKSHRSVMRQLALVVKGKGKTDKVMNAELESSLIKIINKEIVDYGRTEAMELLMKATKEEIGVFLYYYHSESILVPAVLDTIKDRLVKEGKLKFKKNDTFGLLCRPDFKEDESFLLTKKLKKMKFKLNK
jgi:hypothetical protein